MADYNARIAPFINETFYITSVFGEQPRNHKGLDISTGTNSNVYSTVNGTVVRSDYSSSYGNVIIIKATDGIGHLFAHLRDLPLKNVGDTVVIGEQIGVEGTTGQSSGIHLHYEMQDITNANWNYNANLSEYLNPADFMGFPNIQGISAFYNGTPIPPSPTFRPKGNFKWVLYAKKLRTKRNIF